MNDRDFKGLILPLAFFLVGTIVIATGMGHPLPAPPPGCGVLRALASDADASKLRALASDADASKQKIERQTQIAYVLKPPPAPPPETIIVKESCPAPIAQKCELSQIPEKAACSHLRCSQERAAEEETAEPQRKRKRHRYRHWRRRRWTLM